MLQPAPQELSKFLSRWRPTIGDDDYAEFVEGVRRVVVSAQVQITKDQRAGRDVDAFLNACTKTFNK